MARIKQSKNTVSHTIRWHKSLRNDLKKLARENQRSLNAEVVRRLESTLVHKIV